MRDEPLRLDKPLIYHLDVAAMYPNIMLSNRLQPDSVVDESVCAVCDYNRPGKACDRRMTWAWRGEFFPARRDEYNMIKHALNQEMFPPKKPGLPQRKFVDLTDSEQSALLHKRLGDYSRKVYKKIKDTKVENREAIICQRENPFYIDTVRRFRDRRYEYKGLHKTWKKNLDTVLAESRPITEVDEAKKMIVLYDSLQLAHKCILNSFYGYVMRKGARWHSMEMAGITCLTGATIIQMARQLVEQIGRPLELDTDGIWCMLPGIFPENFKFKLANGKAIGFSYPCTMLNHLVHAQFTNHQYHDLVPETGEYVVHSENSIFFELDGPYKAMILPSSKEEDKLLKKRYAVFNDDGSLAELKGFEVKRRGELQLIKIFQSQIFEKFLLGTTTQECYAAVAQIADQWLDVLFSKAENLDDEELIELIAENRSMSRTLAEYAGQKSTSISTAKRLAEFLGDQMVKDKGLACKFVISAKPHGAPVTDRAVPVAIFSAEDSVKQMYLRRWLKDNSLISFDLRSILDWEYYIERLGSVIQKLITIPAAMQKVSNPVPRIRHPDWLHRRVAALEDKFRQHKVTDFFKRMTVEEQESQSQDVLMDVEDNGQRLDRNGKPRIAVVNRKLTRREQTPEPIEENDHPEPTGVDPRQNYSQWLQAVRGPWKRLVGRLSGETSTVIPSMFRGVRSRTINRWDIVQIRPGRTPGRFIMWIAADQSLIPIPLRIPREFYIHTRTPPRAGRFKTDMYSCEKVVKVLPRESPCANLYKVIVREDLFIQGQEHFTDLTNDLNVDGVYELQVHLYGVRVFSWQLIRLQVPLITRALLKLGKVCISDAPGMTLNRAEVSGFDLNQLDRASPTSVKYKYLGEGRSGKYLFLYHACAANAPVHVFALFLPNGPVKLHVVDPAPRRQPIPRLQETYLDLLNKRLQSHGTNVSVTYHPSREFTSVYHGSDVIALKAISRDLATVESQSFITVISSVKEPIYFESQIPKLTKFPVLYMPKTKSAHSLDVFPWQPAVAQKLVQRYLILGSWLDRSIALADYYDVPVGHVEGDQPLALSDLEFARRLTSQDIVLWWSPSDRPDLGGIEDDRRPCEDFPKTEFTSPGCYSNVCLEMTVRNLAVNAVLHSVIVNELEGSGGATAFDSSRTLDEYAGSDAQRDLSLGESSVSPQTFAILKNMVKTWLIDKIQGNFESPAAVAVDHFWRWISSNASNLYDPGIHRFIHGLMRKTFIQMLAEFKRLGSHVVYADLSRILLVTSKPPGTAHAYATYITTAVTSHELFQHVFLHTERFYDFLLFMDEANLGGVVCEDPLVVEPPDELCLEMRWNIETFLPPVIQEDFKNITRYFLIELFKVRQKTNEKARAPLRVLQNSAPDATQRDAAKTKELELSREFISRRLTRRCLKAVGNILERHREDMMDEQALANWEFPLLPGSHLHLTNPELEFIKFICAIFGLTKEHQIEVGLLKRSLLDIVGVREFANEAVFHNPCEPLKLSNVPCRHCDGLRDFDFCRDPELLPDNLEVNARWLCVDCGGEYDRMVIELALMEIIYELERRFAQQDLRCGKCKQIRSDNVSKHCQCSGSFQLTINKADIRRNVRTIVNVSIMHNLTRLRVSFLVLSRDYIY